MSVTAMSKEYDSVSLARFMIAYGNENGFEMNMTKLQKLLYIAYGVYLAVKNERLTNEHPQAWPYGPVFPTTRNKLLHVSFDSLSMEHEKKPSDEICSLVRLVFNSYGEWTASELSAWSHKENSPWFYTVNLPNFKWGNRIPDEFIMVFFTRLIAKNNDRR